MAATKPNHVLDREHTRLLDRLAIEKYAMSGLVLMENAGRGCAEYLLATNEVSFAVICCGAGNNGGDGLVIARHLNIAGIPVRVLLSSDAESMSPDARANLNILSQTQIPIKRVFELSHADLEDLPGSTSRQRHWIIDALLGTGSKGDVRPPLNQWIDIMNRAVARRMAVDLPSGLDCDTGRASGECIRADLTCTLAALKPCFGLEPGRTLAGKVQVVHIGVPAELLEDVANRQPQSH